MRTEHLDNHMAHLCDDRANRMAESNRRKGWADLCGDIDNIRGLAPLLERHASDEEIREYINNMETACREQLPSMVWKAFT